MPGFERNRFVGLSETIAQDLTCTICLNIFDNPLITDCGHTYCQQCLQSNLESGRKECPECRKQVANRSTSQYLVNTNCVSIASDGHHYVFVRNLIVNSMVRHLSIKCDYESNGCQSVVEVDSLSAHLHHCEHRICKSCGFVAGKASEHNCAELLKNELTRVQQRFFESDQMLTEMIDKYTKLDQQNKTNIKVWRLKCSKYELKIQELQNVVAVLETSVEKNSNAENPLISKASTFMFIEAVDFVMFGTLETKCLHCQIDCNGIELKGISHEFSQDMLPIDIFIPFKKTQELKYCLELSSTVIILKPTDSLSIDIHRVLQLDRIATNKYGFCIFSYGMSYSVTDRNQ